MKNLIDEAVEDADKQIFIEIIQLAASQTNVVFHEDYSAVSGSQEDLNKFMVAAATIIHDENRWGHSEEFSDLFSKLLNHKTTDNIWYWTKHKE